MVADAPVVANVDGTEGSDVGGGDPADVVASGAVSVYGTVEIGNTVAVVTEGVVLLHSGMSIWNAPIGI